MNFTARPPPSVLYVHNGNGNDRHIAYLIGAGLPVSETHADTALSEAIRVQPDIIVLDFECNGEVSAQLKSHAATKHIPIVALLELIRPHQI